jgi:hypothetical protein
MRRIQCPVVPFSPGLDGLIVKHPRRKPGVGTCKTAIRRVYGGVLFCSSSRKWPSSLKMAFVGAALKSVGIDFSTEEFCPTGEYRPMPNQDPYRPARFWRCSR